MNWNRLKFWQRVSKRADKKTGSKRVPMPDSSGSGYVGLATRLFGWSDKKTDFYEVVTDPAANSAVSNCLTFIAKNWPQAVPKVCRRLPDGTIEPVDHPATDLLRNPSTLMPLRQMLSCQLYDYWGKGRGNAYLYIVPGELPDGTTNVPVELQYISAELNVPATDKKTGELYYSYRPRGEEIKLPQEQMIHWKNGMSAGDWRIGVDPLRAVLPEIATDNTATEYQYKLLSKGGVPPYGIGPEGKNADGQLATIDDDDAKFVKQSVMESAQNGEPVVMPVGFKIEKMGFEPKNMVIGETQKKSEERIAGAFGLPAIVAQLGAGLDRSTYSNYEQAIKTAWEECIIPMQDDWAETVGQKLLPLYGTLYGNPDELCVVFDRSHIPALKEDLSQAASDAVALFNAGIISLATAKRRVGEEPLEGDEFVYMSPQTTAPDTGTGGGNRAYYPFGFALEAGREAKTDVDQRNLYPSVSSASELDRALRQYRNSLRTREERAITEMQSALGTVETAVRSRLESLIERMVAAAEDGQTISESWLVQETRFQSLLSQIEAEYRKLAEAVTPDITSVQRATVYESATVAENLAIAAIGPKPQGVTAPAWNRLPVATLENLVGYASNGSPLAQLFEAIGPDMGEAVRSALIVGVGQGLSPTATAALMRDSVAAKLALSKARAETIARTETLRAARETQRQMYAANAETVTGWIWTATLDARTCRGCWAMHGTEHDVGATLDDHPNGRCVPVPKVRSWAELTGDASLPDTRATIETGTERFKTLTQERQRSILGDDLYGDYSEGRIALSDCVTQTSSAEWGTMRRAATVAEARANAARRLSEGN